MLASFIIIVEMFSNSSFNAIISLGPIPCFYFVTIILYICKLIIEKTTTSDYGWLRNGSHKLSANSNLHAFFVWTVTNNLSFVWKFHLELSWPCVYSYCISFFYPLFFLKTIALIWHDNHFIFAGKYGSSPQSLILKFPNKMSGPYLEHW